MTEAEIRAMRNRVYDHTISDIGWRSVRAFWLTSWGTQFLIEHDFPLTTQHSPEWLKEHPQ